MSGMPAPFQVIKKQHKRAATLTHNKLSSLFTLGAQSRRVYDVWRKVKIFTDGFTRWLIHW
jgi:hypothetical protein